MKWFQNFFAIVVIYNDVETLKQILNVRPDIDVNSGVSLFFLSLLF
jgi:hypothetical protein